MFWRKQKLISAVHTRESSRKMYLYHVIALFPLPLLFKCSHASLVQQRPLLHSHWTSIASIILVVGDVRSSIPTSTLDGHETTNEARGRVEKVDGRTAVCDEGGLETQSLQHLHLQGQQSFHYRVVHVFFHYHSHTLGKITFCIRI